MRRLLVTLLAGLVCLSLPAGALAALKQVAIGVKGMVCNS
jgi:hypothetical protein